MICCTVASGNYPLLYLPQALSPLRLHPPNEIASFPVIPTYAIRFYRIYDMGEEIDLSALEKSLADSMVIARASFIRVRAASITIAEPPLLIRLPPASVRDGTDVVSCFMSARIFDFGAISICLTLEGGDAPAAWLEPAALRFAGQAGLDDHFSAAIAQVQSIISPFIGERNVDRQFYDDYTIYIADSLDDTVDPVAVLLGEKLDFSPGLRNDTLKHQLSYGVSDRAILSWSGAILAGPEYPADLIELIEFAAVQVFELRFYDRELSSHMEQMFDDIEVADRLFWYRRLRQYHALMKVLMRTQIEVSEVIEKVNNLIKITDDVYYARVYAMALQALRSSQWTESVHRRMEVIRENYRMLSDEVDVQHSNFLEWVIIILIAIEVAIFLPGVL